MEIPPLIHSLWFQGVPNAPEIVRICLNRWRILNPGYQLKVYHRRHVEELLGKSFQTASIAPQALSDIFRTRLLLDRGGIWVDATVYPTRPLDEWLPIAAARTNFFAFEKPGPDRPLSSWFLASTAGHSMIVEWWQKICQFWSEERTLASYDGDNIPPDPILSVAPESQIPGQYPYFWFHYLFDYCLESDPAFKKCWEETGKLPAHPAHSLQQLIRDTPNPTSEQVLKVLSLSPVQKLDWRLKYRIENGKLAY
jgi:hypothetical protein